MLMYSGMIVWKERNPVSNNDLAKGRREKERDTEKLSEIGKEDMIRRNACKHPLGSLAMTGYAIRMPRQMQFR